MGYCTPPRLITSRLRALSRYGDVIALSQSQVAQLHLNLLHDFGLCCAPVTLLMLQVILVTNHCFGSYYWSIGTEV